MDPKNLDPKLQEAYNRVMNTPTSGDGQQIQNNAASEESQSPEQPMAPDNSTVPQDITSTEIPIQQAEGGSSDPSNPWQGSGIPTTSSGPANTPQYQPSAAYPQDSSSKVKIIFIVGGAFFMVLYAVFWLKVLGFF